MLNSGVHRQIYASIAASMSIFISGMCLGWMTSVTEKFMKHETGVDVDYDQLSWVVCMMDLGTGISPLFTGWLMDRFGRRLCIAALGPLFFVSWLLTLLVPATWALYAARFMAGLGKGASCTVVPVFLGEIASVDIRGALGTVFTIQLSGGVLFEVMVGPRVSYGALNAVSTAVPVLFFAMFLWVPESPYHLLRLGRGEAAAECLRWYRCADDVADELRRMEANVRADMERRATYRELFANRRNVRALTVVLTASACHRAGGISSVMAYAALILPDQAPVVGKYAYVTAFAVALVAFNFVGLALVDRVGRKPLLVGSEAALGAVTFLFGLYYCARDLHAARDPAALAWVPYACYVSFAVAYSLGLGFVPTVLMGEMFPANVRSQCSAIVAVTLAVCSFASNKIFLMVSRAYGYHVMFWLFAAVNLVSAYCAHRYALETNGKTFQEIQEMLDDTLKTDDARKEQKRTAGRGAVRTADERSS